MRDRRRMSPYGSHRLNMGHGGLPCTATYSAVGESRHTNADTRIRIDVQDPKRQITYRSYHMKLFQRRGEEVPGRLRHWQRYQSHVARCFVSGRTFGNGPRTVGDSIPSRLSARLLALKWSIQRCSLVTTVQTKCLVCHRLDDSETLGEDQPAARPEG